MTVHCSGGSLYSIQVRKGPAMPYCPSCRLEYRPGFTRCPDCDKALVDQLSEPPPKPVEPDYMKDWVPVAQFSTQAYAVIIEDGFKSLGIPVVNLSSTGHFGQIGMMGTTVFPADGAYIILGPPKQVQAADREGEAMLGETWRKCRMLADEG